MSINNIHNPVAYTMLGWTIKRMMAGFGLEKII